MRPARILLVDDHDHSLGPEVWSYLSVTRGQAADRMVFVASGPPMGDLVGRRAAA